MRFSLFRPAIGGWIAAHVFTINTKRLASTESAYIGKVCEANVTYLAVPNKKIAFRYKRRIFKLVQRDPCVFYNKVMDEELRFPYAYDYLEKVANYGHLGPQTDVAIHQFQHTRRYPHSKFPEGIQIHSRYSDSKGIIMLETSGPPVELIRDPECEKFVLYGEEVKSLDLIHVS